MRAFGDGFWDPAALPGKNTVSRIDEAQLHASDRMVNSWSTRSPSTSGSGDHMIATVEHLMTCGFAILHGYTQSDEDFVAHRQG